MFLAIRERRFAKRVINRLLKSYSTISAEKPELSGEALYKDILLHSRLVDQSDLDQTLWEAEDSVDEYTSDATKAMGLRQVAHFVVMSQFRAAGHVGSVVSLKDIVYSMIPADL